MSLRRLSNSVVIFTTLACTGLQAQEIAGQWQGTLKTPGPELRMVLQIAKDGAGWKADLYSIDQTTDPLPATSISLNGGILKFRVDRVRAAYEGKLSADSNAIAGTFTQGVPLPGTLPQGGPLPLEFKRASPETAWVIDPGKHSIQFIAVDKDAGNDVKLEVLDWGGSGPPMVFLTGLGNNAHVFDKFAPKFTDRYHVYGITRRGFGRSSEPAGGYGADRLGDDVLAVIDSLKLSQPVLVGHSIGGEEMSSIGSRHPEKVAALVYLDAGYWYAFYDSANPNHSANPTRITGVTDVYQKLEKLMMQPPADPNTLIKQLLESDLPQLTKDLEGMQKEFAGMTAAQLAAQSAAPVTPGPSRAILMGGQKYNRIPVPILAIYAIPHDVGPLGGSDPAARAAAEARDEAMMGPLATAFEKGLPTAHVVRIPHANHYVFNSNEADVIREMNAFLGTLKRD